MQNVCDEVAQFMVEATGRGDYAEIEPVPLRARGHTIELELIRAESEAASHRRAVRLRTRLGKSD